MMFRLLKGRLLLAAALLLLSPLLSAATLKIATVIPEG